MPVVLVGIVRADGTPVYGVATDMDGVAPRASAHERFASRSTFPRLPLLPGKYLVRAHALDPEGVRLFDNVESPWSSPARRANWAWSASSIAGADRHRGRRSKTGGLRESREAGRLTAP